jgi:hypothetical protein
MEVKIIALQNMLKLVYLRLETRADTRLRFSNVAASMAGEIASISLLIFLFRSSAV